jgi:hypothetical protein
MDPGDLMNTESSAWRHVNAPTPQGKLQIVLVSVLTSALLLLVHIGIDRDWSWMRGPEALTLWYTALIPVPLVVALLTERESDALPWIAGAGYALVLAPLAWHTGHATSPGINNGGMEVFCPYVLALAVASFVAVPFGQAWRATHQSPPPYAALYQNAWNNALTLAVAGAFVAAVWMILGLWAGLFDLLGIEFFKTLFSERNFVYPVTGLLAGFGLVLGRTQFRAVQILLGICLALGRVLFLLVAGVALLFLGALLVQSLAPLWATGHATALLDALVIGAVLLINAVYQDGSGARPYPGVLRGLAATALLALPVFAGVALYAIHLRTAQHGWTQARLWGALITLIAAAYAGAYAFSVLARRERWLGAMGPANVAIAALLVLVLLATQSPLLDFRAIAVSDQLARTADPAKLDLNYLRFEAGRPGYEALLALKSDARVAGDATLRAEIDAVLARKNRWEGGLLGATVTAADLHVVPAGTEVPAGLLNALRTDAIGYAIGPRCGADGTSCVLAKVALGAGGESIWVFFNGRNGAWLPFYALRGGTWRRAGQLNSNGCCEAAKVAADLASGSFKAAPAAWNDLLIGTQRFHVEERPDLDH